MLQRPDMTDLIDDDANHDYLKQQLSLEFAKHTLPEWEQLLAGKDTCVTPVLDFAEAVAAEQTKANEMVLNVEDAELGSYRQLGFAMKLSKTPAALRKRAPRLGEDTQLVLSQAIADEKLLAEALQSK